MKDFEEVNLRFRRLLRSIENNNRTYFPSPGSIFNCYTVLKKNSAYSIRVIAKLPVSLIHQIEAAFLDAAAASE